MAQALFKHDFGGVFGREVGERGEPTGRVQLGIEGVDAGAPGEAYAGGSPGCDVAVFRVGAPVGPAHQRSEQAARAGVLRMEKAADRRCIVDSRSERRLCWTCDSTSACVRACPDEKRGSETFITRKSDDGCARGR